MSNQSVYHKRVKVGIVSFTDTREVAGIDVINRRNLKYQSSLASYMRKGGFDVVEAVGRQNVNSKRLAAEAAHRLLAEEVDCVAIGCWKWTDPMLVVELVRRIGCPVMLVGVNDPDATALGCIAAVGAALWEIAPGDNALRHERCLTGFDRVSCWARGAGALTRLRRSSILLWGGSYCLKMPHLEDDNSYLKSFLIGDILNEDQYVLIRGADELLKSNMNRITKFINKCEGKGMMMAFDARMFTPDALRRQVALYLAAKDRLKELALDENIAGVSVKCQPEISEVYGVTACTIPAFVPYTEDAEGRKPLYAAVCEGDIKGLITSVALQFMSGKPAGFGDIRTLKADGREHLVISNCGGASIYYSRLAGRFAEDAAGVDMSAQCQGASGGAVGYRSPGFGEVTVARLIRIAGEYRMQYAVGNAVETKQEWLNQLGWGSMWPITVIDIGLDLEDFVSRVSSNHFSFIPGDFSGEIEFFCSAAGIEVERME
ncbi:MAG: fucose isomerase [bacterium]